MTKTLREIVLAPSDNSTATDAGLLVLRVAAGLMLALGHGMGKLPPSEKFIAGVGGLGFPLPVLFAWAAAVSEFFGGLFVAIGLLTRPAALLMTITMFTAAFLRHASDPFQVKEKALLFLAISVLFLVAGAGRFSIDRLITGGSDRSRD